ncbi:MAG: hypothetical protein ACLP9S_18020 [Syntrophales bacterium]
MKNDPFIHLCQPDANKSCGACCGLYNYADSTKDSLSRRLRERTKYFREMVASQADLTHFSRKVKMLEETRKLYEVIHCCEYLGFLNEGEKKVGCLLHPCQNGGADMREASFYGRELCEGHLCPSYHYLSREEKAALTNIANDWYLYGLCVTDIDLVKSYFRLISERVCETPSLVRLKESSLCEIIFNFFSFKISWPFRSSATNRFGKYYFDGSEYMINRIDYNALGCEGSRFNSIFLSLSSEFQSMQELREAERLIEANIDEFARTYLQ